MATGQLSAVVQHLRRVAHLGDGADRTDGQLLECFVARRDEAAFEALVRRHGPMVLGVCRRILRNPHDAEDAFQVTFLVLVRKAASLLPRTTLGNWLYGVAYHTSLKARAATHKRRAKERQAGDMPKATAASEADWHDLHQLLDQELSRLSDKYREPVVLCDLEGKTRKEAARLVGCPEGTLSTRLARARAKLAKRLTQRGVALSAGSLAAVLSRNAASACVPNAVVSSTIKAATLFSAGQAAAAGVISVNVARLTEGVLKTMLLTKLKVATAVLLVVSLLGAGMALLAQQALAEARAAAPQPAQSKLDPGAANGGHQAARESQDRQADRKGRILFSDAPAGSGSGHLGSIRTGDKKETLLFEHRLQGGGFQDGFRISPDGKKVAYRVYESTDSGPKYSIHVRKLDPADTPEDMGIDGQHVCWSPDGNAVAVSGGQSGNVIVDVKTKKQTEIKLRESHWVTDWSPDGSWFLVHITRENGKEQLGRVKKGDSKVELLAGTEGASWGGRISPDGKRILFDKLAEKAFVSNLWILGLEDGKALPVTNALNGYIRGYSWSPSGRRLAYTWVRFDPESAKDPRLEQETESFVMVSDSSGKNPTTLMSRETGGISVLDLTFWDWR